jgi:lipopolysaccharide/colanic/teichoic acid biosynthesis glycosyltransferase
VERRWRRLRLTAFGLDALAVVGAYSVAGGAEFGFATLGPGGAGWPTQGALILGVAALTWVLGWQLGTYRRWALLGGHRVYPRLLTVATYGVVTVILLSYFVMPTSYLYREWLVVSWVGTAVLLSAGRFALRQAALRMRRGGALVRRILIAGANQQGIAVAAQLNNPTMHGTQVLGFLDDYQRPGTEVLPGLRVLGHPASVVEVAKRLEAHEVVIISNGLTWESQRLLAEIVTRPDSPIGARISATFYDLLTTSAELSHVAYIPMLKLHRTRLYGVNAALKGWMDRAVAAVLLTVLSPLWMYWYMRAWMLGVPMLERTQALGLEGRLFGLGGLHPGLSRSPVLSRLPALWNVLRQDMSLVGPRPVREQELRSRERWLPNLFAMRPGLTGIWRVRSGALSVEESVSLDLYYVRNYSLTLDAQILYATGRQLLRRALLRERDNLGRWEAGVRPARSEPSGRAAAEATPAAGAASLAAPARANVEEAHR